jgi:hypothetical protein
MKNNRPYRKNDTYVLLDGRAAFDEGEGEVMLSGSAKECCDAANNDEYGKGCVVADLNSNVMWEWFSSGRWIPSK